MPDTTVLRLGISNDQSPSPHGFYIVQRRIDQKEIYDNSSGENLSLTLSLSLSLSLSHTHTHQCKKVKISSVINDRE